MTDYISREAAKEAAWENIINNVVEEQGMYGHLIHLVDKVFDAIPAADVRPVVRGKWTKELQPNVRYQYKCSICGEFSGHDSEGWIWEPNFCPNCGADMREES